MLAEHVEAAATGHHARLPGGEVLQDERLGLKHLVGGQQVGGVALFRHIVVNAHACVDLQDALHIGPPSVLAAFQPLYLLRTDAILLLQGLDDGLVVEGYAQFLCQKAAHGAAAAT